MPISRIYNRIRAVDYAQKWAFERNPLFASYSGMGGDCTNFVSQCVLAGSCVMNYKPTFGWYYINDGNRAPAWTGVEYFYNFIVSNKEEGPYGAEVTEDDITVGDVIQLGDENGKYYHTLLVSGFTKRSGILVAAHSNDAFNRKLSTYEYASIRYIKIKGVYVKSLARPRCFSNLNDGVSLPPR